MYWAFWKWLSLRCQILKLLFDKFSSETRLALHKHVIKECCNISKSFSEPQFCLMFSILSIISKVVKVFWKGCINTVLLWFLGVPYVSNIISYTKPWRNFITWFWRGLWRLLELKLTINFHIFRFLMLDLACPVLFCLDIFFSYRFVIQR